MRHLWPALLIVGVMASDGLSFAQRADDPGRVVPDPEAFFAAVRANLTRAQGSTHLFSYKERRTNVRTNPFGRLGTDGVEVSQVYPSTHPRLTYRRVLMRDGVPQSSQELARQDREYRARAAGVRRGLQDESDAARRRRADDEALARQRARATIDDIVSALEFKITGRGVHEGTPAITVAFAGNPASRPRTREGRIAQKFAGTVWIHPEQLEVMHAAARATDDISLGSGIIARFTRETTGSLTRRPIEPGLWMPTAARLSGQGRAFLLLRKIAIDFAVDWYDYERFDGSVP